MLQLKTTQQSFFFILFHTSVILRCIQWNYSFHEMITTGLSNKTNRIFDINIFSLYCLFACDWMSVREDGLKSWKHNYCRACRPGLWVNESSPFICFINSWLFHFVSRVGYVSFIFLSTKYKIQFACLYITVVCCCTP